jgi:hypothetical protein
MKKKITQPEEEVPNESQATNKRLKVYDSLTEEQKELVLYMCNKAVAWGERRGRDNGFAEGHQIAHENIADSGLTMYINPDENDDRVITFSFNTKFETFRLDEFKDYTAEQLINHFGKKYGITMRPNTHLKYGNWTIDPDRKLGTIHYFPRPYLKAIMMPIDD